jgi:hypothetical protein
LHLAPLVFYYTAILFWPFLKDLSFISRVKIGDKRK